MLMEAGHPNAPFYAIGRVHDEAGLVEQRQSARIATDALLMQSAISSVLSKEARKAFTKDVKSLSITSKPKARLFDGEGKA